PARPQEDREGPVLGPPPAADGEGQPEPFDGDHWASPPPRWKAIASGGAAGRVETAATVRRTRSRDSAARISAITTRTIARASRAVRWTPTFVASRNSLAITAGMV